MRASDIHGEPSVSRVAALFCLELLTRMDAACSGLQGVRCCAVERDIPLSKGTRLETQFRGVVASRLSIEVGVWWQILMFELVQSSVVVRTYDVYLGQFSV